jgi:hypothetical protein
VQTNLSRVFAAFLLLGGVLAQDHEAQDHEPSRWTLSGRAVAADSKEPLAACVVRVTGHQATGTRCIGAGSIGAIPSRSRPAPMAAFVSSYR